MVVLRFEQVGRCLRLLALHRKSARWTSRRPMKRVDTLRAVGNCSSLRSLDRIHGDGLPTSGTRMVISLRSTRTRLTGPRVVGSTCII